MARKELLAEADKDGIVIRYMGFDLQDPQTKAPRRGFGNSAFAGSSACAEFAASLIVDLMVSPAKTSGIDDSKQRFMSGTDGNKYKAIGPALCCVRKRR